MYDLIKNEPEFEIVSFTPEILEETIKTPIPEIHDRIIVATSRFYRSGILTKDRIILESGEVKEI
ncbi:MAG: type II toxin-antitoxin system VapC family toxin [Euryarchaeota archaeon]|nr:type II toxin-antitoxin system VapC family toxin [Euryarchaeota archaeon]